MATHTVATLVKVIAVRLLVRPELYVKKFNAFFSARRKISSGLSFLVISSNIGYLRSSLTADIWVIS